MPVKLPFRIPFLPQRGGGLRFPAFGGDIRPPVKGPGRIKSELARLAFIRTMLSAMILIIAIVCVVFAIRAPSVMDTDLFVADGSAFGCRLSPFAQGED